MRGGLTRRMLISSGLLALIIATAFAVLLSSVSDLRASERRARQSEEVLVEANQLERLVIDLETGQRGFIITGEQRFLEPWRRRPGRAPQRGEHVGTSGRRQPPAGGAGAGLDRGHRIVPAGLFHPAGGWSQAQPHLRALRGRNQRRRAAHQRHPSRV